MSLAQRTTLRIIERGPREVDLEALVPAIASGSEPARARFYDATSGLLFGLLLLMLSDTATAEKVLLEVYAEVKDHASRFNHNQETLLIWLITIAHRRALEHLCGSSDGQQFLISSGLADRRRSELSHPVGISKSAHRRLVGVILDGFSSTERRMIELAYFSRMTPRAISLELRQSSDVVGAGLQSGIAQLYNLFKNQEFLSEVAPPLQRPQPAHSLRPLPSA